MIERLPVSEGPQPGAQAEVDRQPVAARVGPCLAAQLPVMYNRALADPPGRPWFDRKKLIWWDAEKGRWVGLDEPGFQAEKPPDYRPFIAVAARKAGQHPHDRGTGSRPSPRVFRTAHTSGATMTAMASEHAAEARHSVQ